MNDKLIHQCKAQDAPFILLLDGADKSNELIELINKRTNIDYELIEVHIADWDNDLTPWPNNTALKGRTFGGNAKQLLGDITEMIPSCPNRRIILVGYSLAGLFALWSAYQCNLITDVVCCSGSLWYPGWEEYIEAHSLKSSTNLYLSLGTAEPKSKNPFLRRVGELTEKQYEILKKDTGRNISFEWNEGGHFTNPTERLAKGICWILNLGNGGEENGN